MDHEITVFEGDFQDLQFDVSKHSEALKSFKTLNLLPRSIKPTLRARDLIFVKIPKCKIRIGVTGNLDSLMAKETSNGRIAFEVIYKADDLIDAHEVCAEVRRYFLRHFPGRILKDTIVDTETFLDINYVFISCYEPGD